MEKVSFSPERFSFFEVKYENENDNRMFCSAIFCGILFACTGQNEFTPAMDVNAADQEAAPGNRSLVVYYSPNRQLRETAGFVRKYAGAEILEIQTVVLYPDNTDDDELQGEGFSSVTIIFFRICILSPV